MKTSTRLSVVTAIQFISANKYIGAMQFFCRTLKKREPHDFDKNAKNVGACTLFTKCGMFMLGCDSGFAKIEKSY